MNTKNRVLFSEKYINKLFLLCFCVWWNPLNYISLTYTIYSFTTFIFIIFCVHNIFFYYRVFKKFLKETYFHTNGKLRIIIVICVCILQCKELFIYLAILAVKKSRTSLRLVSFFTWKFSWKSRTVFQMSKNHSWKIVATLQNEYSAQVITLIKIVWNPKCITD